VPVAGLGVLGSGGGELSGEQGGTVVAEDVPVEERGDGGHDGGFAEGDRAVVGVRGGVAGEVGNTEAARSERIRAGRRGDRDGNAAHSARTRGRCACMGSMRTLYSQTTRDDSDLMNQADRQAHLL
jgi:hypothetical protein